MAPKRPIEFWIALVLGTALILLAAYVGVIGAKWSIANRPIAQLPVDPTEHKNTARQPNDHTDVRRGIPD